MPKKKVPHYQTDSLIDKPKEEQLEECVKFVKDNWEKWDNHWGGKISKFESYYDRWRGKPPKRDEEWQSNFHKKLSWQAEKTLVSQYHSALFPISAPIDVDATEVVDELQGIMGKSIVSHWFKIGMFSTEFKKGLTSAAIYGSGFFEDDWFQRIEDVTIKVEESVPDYRALVDENGEKILDEAGNIKSEQVGMKLSRGVKTRKEIIEDRYRVRKSNIFSWRIHPSKLSDDDDFPVIKQEFITYNDLIKRSNELSGYGISGFENLKDIKKDNFKINETDLKRQQKDGEFHDEYNPQLEILSYWGPYAEGEEEEQKKMLIMIVNRKWKLKLIENPRWDKRPPLFHINWTDDEKDSYYGIGVCEIGESAEDRANTTVNIRIDERRKNVKGGGWYNATDKKITKSLLHKTTPGLYKPCSDVNNAVRPDIIIPSTPDDYKEEETSVFDHREITGATTSLMPTADKKQQHDTLGGLQLLIGQASQRLKPDLVSIEMNGIRRMANRAFQMTMQFMDRPKLIEVVASQDEKKRLQLNKIFEFTPYQIIGKVNFVCTGLSETIEKAQKIDKLLKYADTTAKIPPMQAVTNYQGIGKQIALWLGFENIEDLVLMNPANPLMPMQQPAMPVPGAQPAMPGQGGLPPQILQAIAGRAGQPV